MDCGIEAVWPEWKPVKLLGKGSFGRVYEVVRDRFGLIEHCAVKVIGIPTDEAEIQSLKSDGMTLDNITDYYEGIVREFLQEIAVMSKLRGHTNIVGYDDYTIVERKDRFGWDIYIRMELLTSLTAHMEAMQGADPDATVSVNGKTVRVFDETDVVKMAIDMCSALEVCYARHIVHRDIKPDNIFVSDDGNYKLGDFGVAKTVEKTVSGLSKKGTPTYMAPEIYKGEPGGTNSDIYSLGIVLYKLLNDNREPFLPPFPETVKYEHKQQALARRMNGDVPPRPKKGSDALWEIVKKACACDAAKRWQNPTDLKQALAAVLQNDEVKQAHEKPPAPKPAPSVDETIAVRKAQATAVADETVAAVSVAPSTAPKTVSAKSLPVEDYEQVPFVPSVPNERLQEESSVEPPRANRKGCAFLVVFVIIVALVAICIAIPKLMNNTSAPSSQTPAPETPSITMRVDSDSLSKEAVELSSSSAVGDVVTFGTYEQDNNTENGAEDIEWIVLDKKDGKALVISKYALDCQPYHETYKDVSWKTCTLRQWLNNEFLNTAFSETEQGDIVKMTLVNIDNATYGTDGGNDTQDKVFLLSIDEANEYFANDDARECKPTAYAKEQGAFVDSDNCWWWLRSPGDGQDDAAGVNTFGHVYGYGFHVHDRDSAVRPALWITLE